MFPARALPREWTPSLTPVAPPSASVRVHMEWPASGPHRELSALMAAWKRRRVTWTHVYQETYADGQTATGWGDYVRSCVYTLQVCSEHGVPCELWVSHPLGRWLRGGQQPRVPHVRALTTSNLQMPRWDADTRRFREWVLHDHPHRAFVEYAREQPAVHHRVWTNHLQFPVRTPTSAERAWLQHRLAPSADVVTCVDARLRAWGLCNRPFRAVHVRAGDAQLVREQSLTYTVAASLASAVAAAIAPDEEVVLVADCPAFKRWFAARWPRAHTHFDAITHVGEGVAFTDDALKHTMLDYFLLARATDIRAFTVYPHGTGFSQWCAVVYDLPYQATYCP